MIRALPYEASQLIEYRFPDYLDVEGVRHSDECYTMVLLDLDYKYYTFRLNLSLDGRWTLAPLSGFEDDYPANQQQLEDKWEIGGKQRPWPKGLTRM